MSPEQRATAAEGAALAVRSGGLVAALPIADVLETMRPLPIQAVADAPAYVRGLASIRGDVLPVVDLATVLGAEAPATCRRFVTVRTGDRKVALAVEDVLGLVSLTDRALSERPALLGEACPAVTALAAVDAELLAVLRTAALVPPSLWGALGLSEASP